MTRTAQPSDFTPHAPRADSSAPAASQDRGRMMLTRVKNQLSGQHITGKHLLLLTSQLSVMLSAGCDLCAGLEAMARQEGHPRLRAVTLDLHEAVKRGQAFSQALARHPDVFDSVFVAMVRAGEQAGMLKNMLSALQIMIRNQLRIVSSVRSALMYPAVLVSVAVTAIVVMTTFVLPRFAAVFAASHTALPTPTIIVIAASTWMRGNFPLVIGGVVALVMFLLYLYTRPAIRHHVDAWSLKMPLIGPALRLAAVCRSIQTLGMMAKSGLPLADSLLLVRDMMTNVHFKAFFADLRTHITEGKTLAADFEKTTLFPAMVCQMVSVGEQTGTLATVCLEISAFFEEELMARIKVLTTAIEPLIIVFLGGFVGFIAVSVILPMFKIASAVH